MKTLYRLLLKLYPARFREEFAAPLERQFDDEYRDAAGRGEQAMLWLRTLADLAVTIPAELLREVGQDLRYAARVYRKRSLATVLALSALALAIGATTGVFSVVNALLIRSLPFRQPERLVQTSNTPVSAISGRSAYFGWRDSSTYLADAAAFFPTQMNLGSANQSTRVPVAEVSANFFALLGSEPAFGRSFAPDEDLQGHDGVAVIGHALWQQFFGGDPRVLGATIHLNGTPMTVIGVAPATLDFPGKTAVWTPTIFDYAHLPKQGALYAETIGRLRHGVTLAQASGKLEAQLRRLNLRRLDPEASRPQLTSLQAELAGPIREASLVLLGLVAFVLLIACANVAHLLLSRVAERRQELTVRSALGASRARLVQQLITESTLLTLLAAGAGLGVAQWASRLASAAQPAQLAVQDYSVLDWRVVGFAVGVAALTGILFGVLPAWLVGRMQSGGDALRSRGAGQSSGAGRMRAVLLALQGAFALVLVAGSFTMGRSFLRLLGTDMGFHTDRVVTLNVAAVGDRWEAESRSREYYRQALDRLRAVPGVESAGAVDYLPLMENIYMAATFTLDTGHSVSNALVNAATPDYFRTMGTHIVEGRDFNATDQNQSDRVAIVNEEFARQLGIGPHIVGRRITTLWPTDKPIAIVGVIQNVLTRGPDSKPGAQVFLPAEQFVLGYVTFVARVHGAVTPYLAVCRDAVQQVDREVPVYDVKTLDQRLSDNLARPRFYTTAVLFFGIFALLLAVVGIYGAASYSIAQRTHEIGVRIALGASPGGLRNRLLWQSMLPMACGAAIGIAGAAVLGRYLQHLIAGSEATGAWTCAAAAAALAATAALAVWTATRRIVRMDPTAALRAE
jgi:putative ABC transport system permease protein